MPGPCCLCPHYWQYNIRLLLWSWSSFTIHWALTCLGLSICTHVCYFGTAGIRNPGSVPPNIGCNYFLGFIGFLALAGGGVESSFWIFIHLIDKCWIRAYSQCMGAGITPGLLNLGVRSKACFLHLCRYFPATSEVSVIIPLSSCCLTTGNNLNYWCLKSCSYLIR